MAQSPHRARAATFVLAAVLAVVALPGAASSAPSSAVRSARGSLTVTSTPVVGGSAVTFSGNIGATGRRAVHIQWNMNRTGDVWVDVAGTTHMTDSSGRFDFLFLAPSALGLPIGLRVASGSLATNAYQLQALPQELTVSLEDMRSGETSYAVAPGELMSVVVDTTPDVRAGMGTPPAFPGRSITLQRRVDGDRWSTIDTGVTDGAGLATFSVPAPMSGEIVLRARQERWTEDGSKVGWFPSFPTTFVVDPTGRIAALLGALFAQRSPGPVTTTARKDPLRPTASQTWGWGTSLWDYDWGFGEDFDSSPYRGTGPGGTWLDTSDGSGRAVPFNGGLVLQSKLAHTGPGDVGTTTATLQGGSQARGRWEFRLQGHAWEAGPRPYRFLLELVPQGAPEVACSATSIVVADVLVGRKGVGYGVRSQRAGSTWTGRDRKTRLAETPFNMAVEVAKDHITWFRDGKPIGTVADKRAQLRVPLVPRLSLIGGDQEMNGAQVDSDWQRMFTLAKGKQVTTGRPLAKKAYSGTC